MGFRINTNIDALNAQRNLGVTSNMFSKSVERLSSGLRINRAGDDAAGLSISEKLRAQVRGLNQAARNAQDGISMIQTAEGAMSEVHAMLQRMRELAVQAGNDSLSSDDRKAINTELQQLMSELDGVSARTTFNGQELLTGKLATTDAGTGTLDDYTTADGTNDSAVTVSNVNVTNAKADTTYTLTNSGADLTLSDGTVTQQIAVTISADGTQTFNFDKLGVSFTLTAETSAGTGAAAADIATGLNNMTVITAAGNASAKFQIGADAGQEITVGFNKVDSSADSMNIASALSAYDGDQSQANASALLSALDGAITYVSEQRSSLGAYQNRLEHTIANLAVAAENQQASESRIRDTDVAAETVQFVKAQILQQAGMAILAQANQSPQSVLALLQ